MADEVDFGASHLRNTGLTSRVDAGDVSRVMQLAFLAPELVERILDGSQPASLTATRLKRIGDLPLLWDEQIAALA